MKRSEIAAYDVFVGIDVVRIPPRKFRQVADTYDEGKSDAKDVFIIADTARSQPWNFELVRERSDAMAQMSSSVSLAW